MNVVKGASVAWSEIKPVDWADGPLVIGVLEDQGFDDRLKEIDLRYGGALTNLVKDHDFKGGKGLICSGRLHSGSNASSLFVWLVGLGKTIDGVAWREFGRDVARAIPAGKYGSVGVLPPCTEFSPPRLFHCCFSSLLANSIQDKSFKSCTRGEKAEKKTVYHALGLEKEEEEEDAIRDASGLAAGIATTMQLVNAPSNHATPTFFAQVAQDIFEANPKHFSIRVLDQEACASYQKGMGLFLGVAQGSAQPPKFIHLVYNGNGVGESCSRELALVGKGVTFDSGGLNIKAGEGSMIELMKFDCGGAASVLGTAVALSKMCPKDVQVHFVIAACENMIDAGAIRPGDILQASNGKTVEVNNTDAEGRLTLADALIYVQNETECRDITTVATLTGACIVALGQDIAGLLTNSDSCADSYQEIAKVAGEPIWRLPLAARYRTGLDSIIADLKNTGPRPAGTITSALFLQEFVHDETTWAHLDIAGPVWDPKHGATGFSVATLVEKVHSLQKKK